LGLSHRNPALPGPSHRANDCVDRVRNIPPVSVLVDHRRFRIEAWASHFVPAGRVSVEDPGASADVAAIGESGEREQTPPGPWTVGKSDAGVPQGVS
jgi:hypothetical protein